MRYIDLHCDTLTVCADGGGSLKNCNLQVNLNKLNTGGCAAQCFAVFTQGDGAASSVKKYLDFYKNCGLNTIKDYKTLNATVNGGESGAILTVENLGFTGGDLTCLDSLAAAGVKMASLVWNFENDYAYPNLIFRNGIPDFDAREDRGLKPLGKEAVKRLDELKIIVDISHLSDGGAENILRGRKIPIVASHSNAAEVCGVSRNLTDGLIKKIADCGGVIGVNFCSDFLGGSDTFNQVLRHLKHLMTVGGEDVLSFGSDFDGIPATENLEGCEKMPALISYLSENFPLRVLEKLCYKNFLRVFKEVCG